MRPQGQDASMVRNENVNESDVPYSPGLRLSWFNWWVSFAPEFQCCHFCESHVCFILVLILISMFLT